MKLQIRELKKNNWNDLEALFGERGAVGGCWCMWWRISRSEYEKQKGAGNKRSFKQIVNKGRVPGLLAYHKKQPVGWCSMEPRENFPVLDRSRVLKKVDERQVWSIVCFFIHKDFRDKGVSVELIKAAVNHARKKGAEIVEGYPHEPKNKEMPDVFAHTGIYSAFKQAGFVEVERRSSTRPIMRYYID